MPTYGLVANKLLDLSIIDVSRSNTPRYTRAQRWVCHGHVCFLTGSHRVFPLRIERINQRLDRERKQQQEATRLQMQTLLDLHELRREGREMREIREMRAEVAKIRTEVGEMRAVVGEMRPVRQEVHQLRQEARQLVEAHVEQ